MNNTLKHLAGCARLAKAKTLLVGGLIAVALALSFLFQTQPVQAKGPQTGDPYTLAGSWLLTVGAPPGPVFTAYETFTKAGGSVEINNGPAGSTTGIGTWVRTGPRTFLATFLKQQFDSTGQFQLTIKVRREMTLSPTGNEFTGRDNVDLFDPDGNRLPSDIPPSPFRGIRLAVESLDR